MQVAEPRAPARRRAAILALIVVACAVAMTLYVARRAAATRERRAEEARVLAELTQREPTASAFDGPLERLRRKSHLVFLEPRTGASAHLAFAPLDDLEHGRVVTSILAERVHAAGDACVCLGPFLAANGSATPGAFLLDARLRLVRTLELPGVPSRVRVSADGTIAAATCFVSGDAYDVAGFSTRTTVFTLDGGREPFDLERLSVAHGARTLDAPDVNYWGVTFASPPTRFYATLKTADELHLIEASLADRSACVIGAGVECPSLSPDGTRIAFKRISETPYHRWAIAVLDLATGEQRVCLGEERSIDDQVEWLDDHRVLYAVPKPDGQGGVRADVWLLDVDAGVPAHLFLAEARSPCVVRR